MQPTEKSEELQKLRNGQVLHCLGFSEPKYLEVKELMIRIRQLDKRFTHFSVLTVSYVPSFLMYTINQASVFIKGENKYDLSLTINITIMMVLASIYLSVSNSLPETANIKPVEIWLLFNLIYNFCLIITLVIMQVRVLICLKHHIA